MTLTSHGYKTNDIRINCRHMRNPATDGERSLKHSWNLRLIENNVPRRKKYAASSLYSRQSSHTCSAGNSRNCAKEIMKRRYNPKLIPSAALSLYLQKKGRMSNTEVARAMGNEAIWR